MIAGTVPEVGSDEDRRDDAPGGVLRRRRGDRADALAFERGAREAVGGWVLLGAPRSRQLTTSGVAALTRSSSLALTVAPCCLAIPQHQHGSPGNRDGEVRPDVLLWGAPMVSSNVWARVLDAMVETRAIAAVSAIGRRCAAARESCCL